MFVACKRRKMEHITLFEPLSRKRKWKYNIYYKLQLPKKLRLSFKIKRNADRELINPLDKKQKVCDNRHCLVHEEEYICNIYDCSGIKCMKEYNQSSFMSYIN